MSATGSPAPVLAALLVLPVAIRAAVERVVVRVDEHDGPGLVVDLEILEKYLPSFEHLQIPFLLVSPSGPLPDLQDGFATTVGSVASAQQAMAAADRVLVF